MTDAEEREIIFRKGMERGYINAKGAVEAMQVDQPFNVHEVIWAINASKNRLLGVETNLSERYFSGEDNVFGERMFEGPDDVE